MPLSGLYVITDNKIGPYSHEDIASAAVAGGASVVQLRDKTATDDELLPTAKRIRRVTAEVGVTFIVNDRIDLAAVVGADGVNVGQEDIRDRGLTPDVIRKRLGEKAIIGVSCHSLDDYMRAYEAGADYIGFGPVFATSTKTDTAPVRGTDLLNKVCEIAKIPVVAIGGITYDNIDNVRRAHCAAVISAVAKSDDPTEAVRKLREKFTGKVLK
ncbi:MAG: thiamine phosphate synthase [Abditibacteriota bacterium]|nr:thiamine phosphate synthase [Abditibacteriota bacterium]